MAAATAVDCRFSPPIESGRPGCPRPHPNIVTAATVPMNSSISRRLMRRADGVGVESDRFMSSGSTLKPKQKEAVVGLLFYAVRPIRSKRTYLEYPTSLQREMRPVSKIRRCEPAVSCSAKSTVGAELYCSLGMISFLKRFSEEITLSWCKLPMWNRPMKWPAPICFI